MENENRLEPDANQLIWDCAPRKEYISLSIRPVWSFFAVRFMGNQGSMDSEDESFVFFCVGVLRPSQQQGHVEPVS